MPTQFIDDFLDSLIPFFLELDWSVIHIILAIPFILMLANYLNGGCDVAESAGLNQNSIQEEEEEEEEENNHKNGKRLGFFDRNPRVGLALMVLAFFWQIHCVWLIAARYLYFNSTNENNFEFQSDSKNLLLSHFFSKHTQKLFSKMFQRYFHHVFHVHVFSCVAYLVCCIVIWKRAGVERRECGVSSFKEYREKYGIDDDDGRTAEDDDEERVQSIQQQLKSGKFDDETRLSYCRKCRTALVGRDHHCRWLACCIGQKTRNWYIASIFFASIFAICDMLLGAFTLPALDDQTNKFERYYILIGYIFSIGATVFLAYQVAYQVVLKLDGQTKVGRARRKEIMIRYHQRKKKKE